MAKYYTEVFVTPTEESWIGPYTEAVPAIVAKWGGRYLALTTEAEPVEGEGELAAFHVIVEWPDRESAHRFYDDPEYEPYRTARLQGSTSAMALLPGLET